jgi:hypothetical protein
MKSFWNYLVTVADTLCRARAAAELSRRGMVNEARQLMMKD